MKETLLKIIKHIDAQKELIDEEDCSLVNGLCGLAIYHLHAARFLDNPELASRGTQLLETVGEKLETGNIDLRIFHAYSYGLSGIAYTYWYVDHYELLSTDDTAFEGMEELLLNAVKNDFKRGITDNLHGPMGVVHYLNKKIATPASSELIGQIIDLYELYSKTDELGIRISNSILRDTQASEYNLSWSHGLSGNLKIFADALNGGITHPNLTTIIQNGLDYIARTELIGTVLPPANSHYPTSVIEQENVEDDFGRYKARLAWCYGDLNIAFLYLHLAKVFDRTDYYQKGLLIAKNTLHRLTIKDAQVLDIFFCHGSSGLAYLYFKLYRITKDPVFLKQADHWYDHTLDRINNAFDQIHTEAPNSILEGFPGVALALMSRLSEEELGWDDIFFLNL